MIDRKTTYPRTEYRPNKPSRLWSPEIPGRDNRSWPTPRSGDDTFAAKRFPNTNVSARLLSAAPRRRSGSGRDGGGIRSARTTDRRKDGFGWRRR